MIFRCNRKFVKKIKFLHFFYKIMLFERDLNAKILKSSCELFVSTFQSSTSFEKLLFSKSDNAVKQTKLPASLSRQSKANVPVVSTGFALASPKDTRKGTEKERRKALSEAQTLFSFSSDDWRVRSFRFFFSFLEPRNRSTSRKAGKEKNPRFYYLFSAAVEKVVSRLSCRSVLT